MRYPFCWLSSSCTPPYCFCVLFRFYLCLLLLLLYHIIIEIGDFEPLLGKHGLWLRLLLLLFFTHISVLFHIVGSLQSGKKITIFLTQLDSRLCKNGI